MWNVIGKDVVEGGVYIVQNFIVRDAVGNLKPVSSDICIRFTNASTFEPWLDELIIPRHKFEFFDLGDLFAEASRLPENANPEFAVGKFYQLILNCLYDIFIIFVMFIVVLPF